MPSIVVDVLTVWKGLPKASQRWLMGEAMRSSDAAWQMRCKIIRNLVRHESPETIARILGCSRSHVYRVAHRFVAQGLEGLVDRREDNGCAKVDEHYAATVLELVAGSPPEHGYERPTWTQELLILVAERRTGVRISTTTMSRLLARLHVRRGRPKPTVGCPWPKARKTRRLNEIQQLVAGRRRREVVLYVDEVDIHLNPKIGEDWMLRGQQKEVLTPGHNVKRYLAGALNPHSGRLTWVEAPRKTSSLFISLVDQLVTRSYGRAERIHLVLDNFRIHSSRAVEAARKRWGERVVFHFLPPYCPDENRIERVWKDLHDNVTRNHNCRTMDALMERVRHYLDQRRRSGRHRYVRAA